MSRLHRMRGLLWALPATVVGLAAVALAVCFGARVRIVDGVIEAAGGRLGLLRHVMPNAVCFEAITLGHVVLGSSHQVLARLRDHEHVHVRQYERWGVFFFPLYAGSSLWQLLRGRSPYRHNCFEREAFHIADTSPVLEMAEKQSDAAY